MTELSRLDDLTYDRDGLIPAIVQDAESHEVLMMAYMNQASLEQTLATGKTHFWSRSRKKFWMKGESSGHVQTVEGVFVDCDADTLLIRVRQHGAACHAGYKSCFFRRRSDDGAWPVIAERLFDPETVYGSS